MNLFFDTETTGKYDFRLPPQSHSQPHVVQLAALLTDNEGAEVSSMSVVIQPDGWIVPDEAASIHGITTARARAVGVTIQSALPMFYELRRRAELWVGHNVDFDCAVLASVTERECFDDVDWPLNRRFCTMRATTTICKIPNQFGYDNYKWPKLIEAHQHLFGTGFDGAHDALADVRACARIFFHLKKNFPGELRTHTGDK